MRLILMPWFPPRLNRPALLPAICSVVDEDALRDWTPRPETFDRLAKPVILLVDRFLPIPEQAGMTILMKPLLGSVLMESVHALVACPAELILRSPP